MHDGPQAIEFLDTIDADPKERALGLVLLDMLLPNRSGDAVLRRLRSTERYGQTPVIIISGLRSGSVKEAAIRNAAMVCFKKTSTLEEFMQLGSIVRQVLEQRTAKDGNPANRGGTA